MSEMYMTGDVKAQKIDDWRPVVLKVLIGVLTLFLLAEFAFYLLVIPATSLVRLTVKGAPSVGFDEICAMAGITGRERWIRFDTAEVAGRLAQNPLFETVSVERKFPDRVIVSVTERAPVAVAFGMINGRTVPVLIDRTGIAFRIGNVPAGANLPLLTGIQFENPVAGMRLNPKLRPLLAQISDLESRNSVLLSSVSEIKIEQKTYGGYDIVVYPVNAPVRVRTDRALNEDALQYMMLVLDVVQDLELDVEEIDIRAGTVAYRVRGEQL